MEINNGGEAIGLALIVVAVIALVLVVWPLAAFVCLNWIGGFGFSFQEIVGIGFFAGCLNTSAISASD